VKDYPMLDKLQLDFDRCFICPDFKQHGTIDESIAELKQNWKYIEKHIKRHPCFVTEALTERNNHLLAYIGLKSAVPFRFI
jgi:hypothetical protein